MGPVLNTLRTPRLKPLAYLEEQQVRFRWGPPQMGLENGLLVPGASYAPQIDCPRQMFYRKAALPVVDNEKGQSRSAMAGKGA